MLTLKHGPAVSHSGREGACARQVFTHPPSSLRGHRKAPFICAASRLVLHASPLGIVQMGLLLIIPSAVDFCLLLATLHALSGCSSRKLNQEPCRWSFLLQDIGIAIRESLADLNHCHTNHKSPHMLTLSYRHHCIWSRCLLFGLLSCQHGPPLLRMLFAQQQAFAYGLTALLWTAGTVATKQGA